MATKSLWKAIAILVGAIVGAGVLGIPYAVAQSGYVLGLIILLIVGTAILFEFLMVADLTLSTPGKHQLVGLAKHYLGKKGKLMMQASIFFTVWGAMLAYAIGSGNVFATFFSQTSFYGIPLNLTFSIILLLLFSIPIYAGLKATESVELPLVLFLIGLIIIMCAFAFTHINLGNLQTANFSKAFLPYGVILFAIAGSMVIPEAKQALKGDAKLLRKAVIAGVLIPLTLYWFFTTVVVGVTGSQTSEVATIAFGQLTNPVVIVLGNIFALIAMATSFIALGLVLKDTFIQDLGMKNNQAYLLTMIVPLFMLFVAKSFTRILEITGAYSIGFAGILVGVMALKARKYKTKGLKLKNTALPYIVITIFIFGIVVTTMQILGISPF
ncbi:hypothetical protein GF374_02220 [Candidatus Woesearchaeota archaeon]|nr:hypothetical protein [Candidatus Woesearchaeota archaeon]